MSPSENLVITVGDSVDFSASGTDPGGKTPLRYAWNFGSGSGLDGSTAKDPGKLRFEQPGTHIVTLNVTNSLGKTDPTPARRTITVKNPPFKVIPRKGWKLKYVNSQDAVNYPARFAFDDDPGTFWHTEWGKPGLPPPPHEIQIDLGAIRNVNGFQYLPRQDGFNVGNVGEYQFFVSLDGKKWGKAVASGTFQNSATLKNVFFAKKRARYIRLISVTEVHGYNDSAIAELQVLRPLKKARVKKQASPAPAATLATAASPALSPESGADREPLPVTRPYRITTEVVDGKKYRSLTVTKPNTPDGLKRTVQVSPDLLDWFSGRRHTTVLLDTDTVLKVRDNIPVTPGSKRHIRLKTSPR
jgi:PKD repeat protein